MNNWFGMVVGFVLGGAGVVAHAAQAATATRWTPEAISSGQFESHPAFDPRNGDLYFVRSAPDFSGWRIFVAPCGDAGWGAPVEVPFAGDGVEADPWFTPDGRALYFISTRSTDGEHHDDLDLWKVTRDAAGAWGVPRRLPEPLNSRGREWFPRVGADGWLWFGSNREGGVGKTDIWRAHEDAPGKWTVLNAGPAINGESDDYEAAMSADGTHLVIMTNEALYESTRAGVDWSPRVKLPAQVNQNAGEVGPLLSPTGRTLLFARDTHEPLSGELFLWRTGKAENWPPACARPKHAR
jgi:Tol biopolymer transport system component